MAAIYKICSTLHCFSAFTVLSQCRFISELPPGSTYGPTHAHVKCGLKPTVGLGAHSQYFLAANAYYKR